MLLPAFLMHIDSTFSAVIDMGSGFSTTNGTLHWLSPLIVIETTQTSSSLLFYYYLITYFSVKEGAGITPFQGYFQVSTATDER